jgi:hypothetical protein
MGLTAILIEVLALGQGQAEARLAVHIRNSRETVRGPVAQPVPYWTALPWPLTNASQLHPFLATRVHGALRLPAGLSDTRWELDGGAAARAGLLLCDAAGFGTEATPVVLCITSGNCLARATSPIASNGGKLTAKVSCHLRSLQRGEVANYAGKLVAARSRASPPVVDTYSTMPVDARPRKCQSGLCSELASPTVQTPLVKSLICGDMSTPIVVARSR